MGFEFRSLTLLITTGFTPFNARRKEEYGYGIFKNVITSIELEARLKAGKLVTPSGKIPESVAFIHCVGSRDIRVGNEFCSANCCITGIKQAISIKKLIPDVNVFCLYMDLRLGGRYYEDFYKSSQTEHKIRFVRGRLSEASENLDSGILLKYEDTLAGKPAKKTVDLLVLLVGIQANHSLRNIKSDLDLIPGTDGFFGDASINAGLDETDNQLFIAGCSTGPKSIPQTTADASEVAFRIHQFFQKKLNIEKQVKYDRLRLRNS
jgi:heterodisulfide reductase subunit A